jgi:hypothetical protein
MLDRPATGPLYSVKCMSDGTHMSYHHDMQPSAPASGVRFRFSEGKGE